MGKKHKYTAGDLVICKYELDYLYYPGHTLSGITEVFFVGIVIGFKTSPIAYFGWDTVYEVLCMDSKLRRFTTWEIELLRSGS